AEADPAVDEERVVGARGQLRHRLARGLRELVRGADDEGVECIAWVQPLGGAPRHGWAAGRRRRRALRRGLVHDDGDARVAAETLLRSVLERVEVVLDEPVARKGVRRPDAEAVALDGQEPARANPRIEDGVREFAGEGLEKPTPKAI